MANYRPLFNVSYKVNEPVIRGSGLGTLRPLDCWFIDIQPMTVPGTGWRQQRLPKLNQNYCYMCFVRIVGFAVSVEKVEVCTRARASYSTVGSWQRWQDDSAEASSKWGCQPHYADSGTVFYLKSALVFIVQFIWFYDTRIKCGIPFVKVYLVTQQVERISRSGVVSGRNWSGGGVEWEQTGE